MNKGFLEVNVYNDTIANPIKNATVKILKNNNIIFETKTDESGKTEIIVLDTVDKKYSEADQKEIRPYETYDVIVSAIGLNDTMIKNVQIFDEVTSIQDVYLTSIDNEKKENIETVTPNTLWENYPPNIYTNEINNENEISPYVLKNVIIPKYITVHDGVINDTNAPNYKVLFTDYIKNVASSEIYSTWNKETIKANVLAIISFTLNRVYTEWYKSRGYDFTITSTTTYDQKYTRNGTIFQPISQIVDEIFYEYIKSGIRMEPLLAHYKSNTNEPGVLSQWGSKDLGDKGYNALEILRYYYGNDINIYEAQVSDTYPYSFTKTLKKGDCNIDVYILQNSLNYIRASYPKIPKISNPNGNFNLETENAVKTFQNIFSLSETGKVDYQTWYKISYVLTAVKNLTESIY